MGGGVGGGLCTYIGVLESSYGRGNKEGKRGFMKHKQTWKSKSKIVKFLAQGGGEVGTKK